MLMPFELNNMTHLRAQLVLHDRGILAHVTSVTWHCFSDWSHSDTGTTARVLCHGQGMLHLERSCWPYRISLNASRPSKRTWNTKSAKTNSSQRYVRWSKGRSLAFKMLQKTPGIDIILWFSEHLAWFREHSAWFREHSAWFREHSGPTYVEASIFFISFYWG
jgi:hypothetical protein